MVYLRAGRILIRADVPSLAALFAVYIVGKAIRQRHGGADEIGARLQMQIRDSARDIGKLQAGIEIAQSHVARPIG